ncbi:MAG: hypothetical protein HY072_06655 [Deltaproteobacteria bacterium]|nr:hypothetical protein [Deltaproteobacteria bacterium]
MEILTPSPEIIKQYLTKWDSLENYVAQESSLRKLFTQTYPENTQLDDVLIKVCSLELVEGAKRSSMDELTDWTIWADKVIVF